MFTGKSIGSKKEVISEIVFNTSMTGYLEVLTDPSYAGQAVVMTYPLIGNYGICNQDMRSCYPPLIKCQNHLRSFHKIVSAVHTKFLDIFMGFFFGQMISLHQKSLGIIN